MKICSLLPSATEIIALLGLSDELVGISHECDDPPSIKNVPIMVEPMIPPHGLSSADIDRQVRQRVASGQRLYRLNEHLLRQAQPDLILSQDLCPVCAVTPAQLHDALCSMSRQPTVLALHPAMVHDVIDDVVRIGDAAGRSAEGHCLAAQLRDRLKALRTRLQGIAHRPRVVCLEWLSPLYVAGHWVPEMVQLAGGQDVLSHPGRASSGWDRDMTDRPGSGDTPRWPPSRVLSSFGSVFRELISTKQKALGISLQLLQNPVQCDCHTASLAHKTSEFLKAIRACRVKPSMLSPSETWSLPRVLKELAPSFTSPIA